MKVYCFYNIYRTYSLLFSHLSFTNIESQFSNIYKQSFAKKFKFVTSCSVRNLQGYIILSGNRSSLSVEYVGWEREMRDKIWFRIKH